MKSNLLIMLKGFIIGSSMSVPGVSGGTMAILLGIYDSLISTISNFFKNIKSNIFFLMKFGIGAVAGFGSLAFVISWLLEKFPVPVSFLFLGAVIGGIPALYTKTNMSSIKVSAIVYFILGLVCVLGIGAIPFGNVDIGSGSGILYYIMLFATGICIAIALVLPGISTSHMLIVLGMFDDLLAAITKFDVFYIGVLGVATLVGIFIITKPLEWLMKKYTYQTYCIIIGFVLGSTSEIFSDIIFPAIPDTAGLTWWVTTIVISLITFVLGYKGITSLSKFSND